MMWASLSPFRLRIPGECQRRWGSTSKVYQVHKRRIPRKRQMFTSKRLLWLQWVVLHGHNGLLPCVEPSALLMGLGAFAYVIELWIACC